MFVLKREEVKSYWLDQLVAGSFSLRVQLKKGGERTINVCYDEQLAHRICDALRQGIEQKTLDKRDYRLTPVNRRMKGLKVLQREPSSTAELAAYVLASMKRKRK